MRGLFNQGMAEMITKSWGMPLNIMSADSMESTLFGSVNGALICQKFNLFLLEIPKTKLMTYTLPKAQDVAEHPDGEEVFVKVEEPINTNTVMQVLIQEKMSCPFPTWQEQEQIYHYIQQDPDLKEYSETLFKQLILFTLVSGFLNTKYDKIPIQSNGKIALHDLSSIDVSCGFVEIRKKLEAEIYSNRFGLVRSGSDDEEGIFSHVLPERRPALKAYALQVAQEHCPEEVEPLKRNFAKFPDV